MGQTDGDKETCTCTDNSDMKAWNTHPPPCVSMVTALWYWTQHLCLLAPGLLLLQRECCFFCLAVLRSWFNFMRTQDNVRTCRLLAAESIAARSRHMRHTSPWSTSLRGQKWNSQGEIKSSIIFVWYSVVGKGWVLVNIRSLWLVTVWLVSSTAVHVSYSLNGLLLKKSIWKKCEKAENWPQKHKN